MKNKNVQFALLALFILVGGGLLYYGINGNSTETQGERTAQKVEIIKYSDYQCPSCRHGYELLKPLVEEYGDNVEIIYRHFPLSGFQYSRLAAHVAEAARNQDKFQEMHVLIFESQEEWSQGGAEEYFMGFAEEIGLDMEQFREDVESEEIAEKVERDRQEGIRRTVNATPTYFMNGQKIQQSPQTYEQFKALVELYMYRS
ncbi:MAG: thioredoxin domain-containing protein [Balneolaceae bacterium]